MNRRAKENERFWLQGRGVAVWQLRSAYLGEGGRARRHWAKLRPWRRALAQLCRVIFNLNEFVYTD